MGGWLEKLGLKLISTQVGVEVGVELGKKFQSLSLSGFAVRNAQKSAGKICPPMHDRVNLKMMTTYVSLK